MKNSANKKSTLFKFIGLLKAFESPWLLMGCFLLSALIPPTLIGITHYERLLLDAALTRETAAVFGALYWLLIIFVVRVTATWFFAFLSGRYAESGLMYLRREVVDKLLKGSLAQVSKKHSGDVLSRFSNDLDQFRQFIGQQLFEFLLGPLIMVLTFIYLCTINWQVTIAMTITSSLLAWLGGLLSKPVGQMSQAVQEQLALANSTAKDVIAGKEISRAYGLSAIFADKYGSDVKNVMTKARVLVKRQSTIGWVTTLIMYTPDILIYSISGYLVYHGQMSVGALWAFVQLFHYIKQPLSIWPQMVSEYKVQMVATERILSLLELESEPHGGVITRPLTQDKVVEINKLYFSYESGQRVLSNISLTVHKGESVAIVGPSGCGKSTLLKLLLGLYPPYEGEVKIMGELLGEWSLPHLRHNIMYVSQDTFLFPTSIRQNIGLLRPKASDGQIEEAAKAANAHHFITKLPEGYDTPLGEQGASLSGGQRQRISLARAFLDPRELILLDEPTSALDMHAEAEIQHTIDKLIQRRTSIVVAHRLTTISNADRIIVMDEGRIVEEGSHEELMAAKGLYYNLYQKEAETERRVS